MVAVPLSGKRLLCAASLLASLLTGAAHAAQDCELNGASVNPDNGSTYAGKTGIMKCVDRETRKFLREVEYRSGRAVGYRKSVDMSGKTVIGNYNEQGNRDGAFRELDAEGNLIAEENYVNGSTSGIQVHYHKNRQVRRRAYSEPRKGALASVEYNDRGQLMQLKCADRPLLGEDRALCGFDGKAVDVTFYTAKGVAAGNARHVNGNRLSMTALGSQGAVARSEETQGERRVLREHFPEGALRLEIVVLGNSKQSERELARSGQPVRETRWQDGWKSEETLWYMNGQPKSRTRWERDGRQVLVKADEYWDNGKLRARTVRDDRRGYVGVQQTYTEAGVLETEATYEQGRLTRKKVYKDGRLAADDEYYEDGSRKSVR
jgi:antitoxin component YwqK of YwqJK toxin-antitoxin module